MLNATYRDDIASVTAGLPALAEDTAQDGLPALVERGQSAFVDGFSGALLVGALVLSAAASLVAMLAPRREAAGRRPAQARARGYRWARRAS